MSHASRAPGPDPRPAKAERDSSVATGGLLLPRPHSPVECFRCAAVLAFVRWWNAASVEERRALKRDVADGVVDGDDARNPCCTCGRWLTLEQGRLQ